LKNQYLLEVGQDGMIIKLPFDENLLTRADNSVKAARWVRMFIEQMHGGMFFSCYLSLFIGQFVSGYFHGGFFLYLPL
jgi:hypothetical protein